jgi:TIGR03009 family protein
MPMRGYVLLLVALFGTLPVAAQNVKLNELDAVLQKWEKAMKGMQSYAAVVERETFDKALEVKEKHRGFTMLSKTDKKIGIQARFECANVKNPKSFEKYIYAGADLYEYVPANNTVRHHVLAKNAKGVVEKDTFVSLVLGMTVKHVKERFKLAYEKKAAADGYEYIVIEPKNAKDAAEFSNARLAFDRQNHLIAQIWFRQANGKEVTWNFSKMQVNVQIPNEYFEPKVLPGWQMQKVNAPLILPKLAP